MGKEFEATGIVNKNCSTLKSKDTGSKLKNIIVCMGGSIYSNGNPELEGIFVKPFLHWPPPSSPVKRIFPYEFYVLKDNGTYEVVVKLIFPLSKNRTFPLDTGEHNITSVTSFGDHHWKQSQCPQTHCHLRGWLAGTPVQSRPLVAGRV